MNKIFQFLILLNPFALFIYLNSLYEELGKKDFIFVLFKASLISGLIYMSFAFTGDFIFNNIFKIKFESFRLFGGIVILIYSLIFIVQGKKSFFTLKGTLDELASEIALPFMVGAASVAQCILIAEKDGKLISFLVIVVTLIINFLIIVALIEVKYKILTPKYRNSFDKLMSIFLRVNGFFVGSIGIEMIIKSLTNIFK